MSKAKKAPEETREKSPSLKRAKEVFASHKVDRIYFTSDGTAFIERQHANMHAISLEDKSVKTVTREEAE